MDIFELLGHPDRLHQTTKVVMDHVLKQLRAQLDAAETAQVEGELRRTPDYPGLSLPMGGLAGKNSSATELRSLFICALVPLSAVHGNRTAVAFIHSMAGASPTGHWLA